MTAELGLEGSFPGGRGREQPSGWEEKPVQGSGRVTRPTEEQISLYTCIFR